MKKLIKEKGLLEKKMKRLRREKLWLLLRQEQIKEENMGLEMSLGFISRYKKQ